MATTGYHHIISYQVTLTVSYCVTQLMKIEFGNHKYKYVIS